MVLFDWLDALPWSVFWFVLAGIMVVLAFQLYRREL